MCWLCFAWLAHPITLSTPNHHHSPLFLSIHHPTLLSLSLCVWKRGWTRKWMVWNGVWCGMQHISHCAFIKPSPTPVCLSSFTIPFSLSNPFSSSFLPCLVWLVCLDRKSEGQVWDSPCQTHCAPHPIHTTLFPSNHAPLFNEHMVDWFVMHQNTFHASMVVCPFVDAQAISTTLLLCHSFPPFNTPTTTSFLLLPFPIPFPFTTLMSCHHSTLFHFIHVLIVMIERDHE